jgi:hypothetical protein
VEGAAAPKFAATPNTAAAAGTQTRWVSSPYSLHSTALNACVYANIVLVYMLVYMHSTALNACVYALNVCLCICIPQL